MIIFFIIKNYLNLTAFFHYTHITKKYFKNSIAIHRTVF